MKLKSEMFLSSIVILGNFNPVILNTGWFRRFKILPEKEIAFAEEQIPIIQNKNESIPTDTLTFLTKRCLISPNRTQISFENYYLDLTPQRFVFLTKSQSEFERIFEPVSRIFVLLSHTPINALGINFEFIIDLRDEVRVSEGLKKLLGCSKNIIEDSNLVDVTMRKVLDDKILNLTLTNAIEKHPNHLMARFNFHRNIQQDIEEPGHEVVKKLNDDFISNLNKSKNLNLNILQTLS